MILDTFGRAHSTHEPNKDTLFKNDKYIYIGNNHPYQLFGNPSLLCIDFVVVVKTFKVFFFLKKHFLKFMLGKNSNRK